MALSISIFSPQVTKHDICDNAKENFDFSTVEEKSSHQTATRMKEQDRERKMCRLVTIEYGLRLLRMRNGYAK